ncbi:hypothetical protein HELRODRAFT_177688 [Helobdella robusta]|uniref:Uncharacterized protein n=1 Tax=Helobdella robusta TaxID=6412 RepID=T1FC30_HELRO|nr:hypothetical protein HELRODRAFT_177688 [Helobdella robusta]ESN98014.1 hypothetical protein HELRODRAFT_177688 [Helobdella robusta]
MLAPESTEKFLKQIFIGSLFFSHRFFRKSSSASTRSTNIFIFFKILLTPSKLSRSAITFNDQFISNYGFVQKMNVLALHMLQYNIGTSLTAKVFPVPVASLVVITTCFRGVHSDYIEARRKDDKDEEEDNQNDNDKDDVKEDENKERDDEGEDDDDKNDSYCKEYDDDEQTDDDANKQ